MYAREQVGKQVPTPLAIRDQAGNIHTYNRDHFSRMLFTVGAVFCHVIFWIDLSCIVFTWHAILPQALTFSHVYPTPVSNDQLHL